MLRRSVLLLGAALPAAAPRPVRAEPPCDVPPDILSAARPMQAAARALEVGQLRILAVGSASIARAGAPTESGWPHLLRAYLARRYPDREIVIEVQGRRGASVADNLPNLTAAVEGHAPSLVVWQAGTVELTRGMHPTEMTELMLSGLDLVRRRGADAVLMDQQYSRFLRANANIEPYREKMRLVAASAGATYFPRYDLMQHWVDTGALDLERVPVAQRAAALERLNACLARALADMIIRGITEAR